MDDSKDPYSEAKENAQNVIRAIESTLEEIRMAPRSKAILMTKELKFWIEDCFNLLPKELAAATRIYGAPDRDERDDFGGGGEGNGDGFDPDKGNGNEKTGVSS